MSRDRKSRKSRDMISSLARPKISFESPSTAARRPPSAARRPDLAATKPGRGGRRAQVRRTGAPLAHGPLRRGAAGGAREGSAALRAPGFRRTPPRLTASADPSLPVRLPLGLGLRTRHGGVCRGRPRLPAIARTSSSPGILLARFAISRNDFAISPKSPISPKIPIFGDFADFADFGDFGVIMISPKSCGDTMQPVDGRPAPPTPPAGGLQGQASAGGRRAKRA